MNRTTTEAVVASMSLRDVEPVKTFISNLADIRNNLTAGMVDGDALREALDVEFKRLYGGFGKPEDFGIGVQWEPVVRKVKLADVKRLTLDNWPTVGIVIPAFNAPGLLEQALEGINWSACLYAGRVRLIIVDNGSIPPLSSERLPVRIDEPTSFAAAVNLGMDELMRVDSTIDYFVLFNQDIQVRRPDWLTNLINWMEQRPRCAIAGSKLLYSAGTVQHAGIEIPAGSCGRHSHRGVKAIDPSVADYEQVQGVTGAVFCIRRTALEELGMFDEQYPWTCEDLDYCLRASVNGWEVWYVSDSVLIHDEGTVGKVDPEAHAALRPKMEASAHRFRKVWGAFVDLCAAGHVAVVVPTWKAEKGYCRLASMIAAGFQNAGLNITVYSTDPKQKPIDADGLRVRPITGLEKCSMLVATRFDTVMATKRIKADRKFYMVEAIVDCGGQYRTEAEQAALASYYQMEYELIASSQKIATELENMGRTSTVMEHDIHAYLMHMAAVPG